MDTGRDRRRFVHAYARPALLAAKEVQNLRSPPLGPRYPVFVVRCDRAVALERSRHLAPRGIHDDLRVDVPRHTTDAVQMDAETLRFLPPRCLSLLHG